jgi:hypothetical protein
MTVREEGKGETMVTTPDRLDWFSFLKRLHVLVVVWTSLAHYLGRYQDRLLGGPLGLPGVDVKSAPHAKHTASRTKLA